MPSTSYQTVGDMLKATGNPSSNSQRQDGKLDFEIRETNLPNQGKSHQENVLSELSPLLGKKDSDRTQEQEEQKRRISGIWGALHGLSAIQQIKTPWWILIALFVMVQMTRINYFVATIRAQYDYLFHDYARAVRVNTVFDIALPAGGVLSIPFIGMVLDNLSTPLTLALLVSMATIIGVLGVLPFEPAAYLNVAMFVLYRPLYYTAVSDYAAKVFGFHTFGKVYGLIICISGLFNFSQSALDALTHKGFGGNPIPANILLLCVAMGIGTVLVGYVYKKSIAMARKLPEEDAEDAAEALSHSAHTDIEDHDSRDN
ncbi:MAG: hypothetical protein MMC23_009313 [Stictis urceolatum]|nr:hypothetical protein [Stictis urceolata]